MSSFTIDSLVKALLAVILFSISIGQFPKLRDFATREGLISLVILTSAEPFAGEPCAPVNDPFAPSGIMPSGPHQGTCLKIHEARSYRFITEEEFKKATFAAEVSFSTNSTFFANVQHEGAFWLGVMDEDSISDVVFQVERFPPEWIAAHTQLRFNFRPGKGMKLYSQTDGGKTTSFLREVILTVEAVGYIGGPEYDLIKGMKGRYGLAKRIVSLRDKYLHMIVNQDHTVNQYRLNFDAKKSNALWKSATHYLYEPDSQYDFLPGIRLLHARNQLMGAFPDRAFEFEENRFLSKLVRKFFRHFGQFFFYLGRE